MGRFDPTERYPKNRRSHLMQPEFSSACIADPPGGVGPLALVFAPQYLVVCGRGRRFFAHPAGRLCSPSILLQVKVYRFSPHAPPPNWLAIWRAPFPALLPFFV